jgi:hypothetical protein
VAQVEEDSAEQGNQLTVAGRVTSTPRRPAEGEADSDEQGNQLSVAGRVTTTRRPAEGEAVQLLQALQQVQRAVEAAYAAQPAYGGLTVPVILGGFVGAEFAAPASKPFRHPPAAESKV